VTCELDGKNWVQVWDNAQLNRELNEAQNYFPISAEVLIEKYEQV
jgi:hypothetical protein